MYREYHNKMANEIKDIVDGGKNNKLPNINEKKLILGIHVNKDVVSPKEGLVEHIKESIKEANDHGINIGAIQVFIANPRTGEPTVKIDTAQYKDLKSYIEQHPEIFFVIHSPYTTTSLWEISSKSHGYAGHTMRDEMKIANDSGYKGVIIHLDHHNVDDVIKNLPNTNVKLSGDKLPYVYLESPHVKPGKSHYETPEKIAKLFVAIRKYIDPQLTRTGFCIDLAHLWSTGVDISSKNDAAKWIEGMKLIHKILPPENILIHLNGSKHKLGAGIDAHAELMAADDEIWGKYKDNYKESGLAQFIAYAKEFSIPCILERRYAHLYYQDYKVLYEHEPSVRFVKKE